MSAKVAKQRAEVETQTQRMRETVAEIDAIGVQVKDLDAGLLDFPCRLDDEIVLLCWRTGETAIDHWHTDRRWIPGRQPVDERFAAGRIRAIDPTDRRLRPSSTH